MIKISVITAVYNNQATLADALISALAQDHPNTELIVVDGGSTDGTLEIIQRYAGQIAQVVSEPDRGIYDALNKGLRLATGDAVGFLHSDDTFADDHVLSRIATALADPKVDACYGDLRYVRHDNPNHVVRHWRAGSYHPRLLAQGWMPPHPTLYLRRALYERHGGFNLRYRIAADYDLMLRMLSRIEGRVVYLPDVLVHMRLGGISNRSLRHILRKSWEDYRVLRTNRIGGIGALAWKNLSKLPQFFFKG